MRLLKDISYCEKKKKFFGHKFFCAQKQSPSWKTACIRASWPMINRPRLPIKANPSQKLTVFWEQWHFFYQAHQNFKKTIFLVWNLLTTGWQTENNLFEARKILQKFEGDGCSHCRHIYAVGKTTTWAKYGLMTIYTGLLTY